MAHVLTGLTAIALLAAACYLALCAVVAHRFTRSRQRPVPGGAHDAGLAMDHIFFPARDQRAMISACYQAAKPRRGAVILVHGKGSCRSDALKAPIDVLTGELVAHGLSVLQIDLRGHGASTPARLTYGEREAHDVLGAVDYLEQRGYRAGTIGVLGASLGGAAALRAAATEPAIAAVVADSTYADFAAMIDGHFCRLTRLPRSFLPGALLVGMLLTGVPLHRVRPVRHARALRGRAALIIHGRHDPLIPVQHAERLAAASGARLWITDTHAHLDSYRDDPLAYGRLIAEFFRRHLLDAILCPVAPPVAPQEAGRDGPIELVPFSPDTVVV